MSPMTIVSIHSARLTLAKQDKCLTTSQTPKPHTNKHQKAKIFLSVHDLQTAVYTIFVSVNACFSN